MEFLTDLLLDTLLDWLKLIPILFLTYLLMEAVEHYAGERTFAFIRRSRGWGPLVGGLLGVVPQCGIAGGAANLYVARVITAGTFAAVILATSDEMLPVMLSAGAGADLLKFILFKLAYGIAAGFALDLCLRLVSLRRAKKGLTSPGSGDGTDEDGICSLCEREGCNCGHDHSHGHGHDHDHDGEAVYDGEGADHDHDHAHSHTNAFVSGLRHIALPALIHTLKVGVLILVVSLLIGLAVELIGEERIAALPINAPIAGELIAALIGLIPNCSVSVMLTDFYLGGLIGPGPLMAGLLVNGGVGLLVLIRMNHGKDRVKDNIFIISSIFVLGVIGGLAASLIF